MNINNLQFLDVDGIQRLFCCLLVDISYLTMGEQVVLGLPTNAVFELNQTQAEILELSKIVVRFDYIGRGVPFQETPFGLPQIIETRTLLQSKLTLVTQELVTRGVFRVG